MDDANPFVISKTEEETVAEEAPAPAPEETEEVPVEPVGDVEALIPLCVKHVTGPQISTATFGYDIAQMERRPWEDPGAKLSDYFNYGFNETSWRLYCAMQSEGEASLEAKASEMLRKLQVAAAPAAPAAAAAADAEPNRGDENMPYDASGAGGQYRPPYGGGGYDRRGGGGGYGGSSGGEHRLLFKTKLCQRFAEGRCTRGAECNYAHGVGELRSAPPMAGGGYGMDGPQGPPFPGAGGYMPPQQYNMPAFRPGGNMGPMPMYGGGDAFHEMAPKRPRGEGGEY